MTGSYSHEVYEVVPSPPSSSPSSSSSSSIPAHLFCKVMMSESTAGRNIDTQVKAMMSCAMVTPSLRRALDGSAYKFLPTNAAASVHSWLLLLTEFCQEGVLLHTILENYAREPLLAKQAVSALGSTLATVCKAMTEPTFTAPPVEDGEAKGTSPTAVTVAINNPWSFRDILEKNEGAALLQQSEPFWAECGRSSLLWRLVKTALVDLSTLMGSTTEQASSISSSTSSSSSSSSSSSPPTMLNRQFRASGIHGDANPMNVLLVLENEGGAVTTSTNTASSSLHAGSDFACSRGSGGLLKCKLIDWEDCQEGSGSYTVYDVAIALTYLLMSTSSASSFSSASSLSEKDATVDSSRVTLSCRFLREFCRVLPLSSQEVSVLVPLIRARCAISLCMSALSVGTLLKGKGGGEQSAADAALLRERINYIQLHAKPAERLLLALSMDAVESTGGGGREEGGSTDAGASSQLVHLFMEAAALPLRHRPASSLTTEQTLSQIQLDKNRDAVVEYLKSIPSSAFQTPPASSTSSSSSSAATLAIYPLLDYTSVQAQLQASSSAAMEGKVEAEGAAEYLSPALSLWRGPIQTVERSNSAAEKSGTTSSVLPPHVYDFSGNLGIVEEGAAYRRGRIGWGRYNEDRTIYKSDHFTRETGAKEPRTLHLGVDLEGPPGTPVYAPLGGTVHSIARNLAEQDYGPTVILRHSLPSLSPPSSSSSSSSSSLPEGGGEGSITEFFTLYGHLSLETLVTPDGEIRLTPGQTLEAGTVLGWVGDNTVNGGWFPHLHFQIITEPDLGGKCGDYAGVCALSDSAKYLALCPDPNIIIRCPWIKPIGWSP